MSSDFADTKLMKQSDEIKEMKYNIVKVFEWMINGYNSEKDGWSSENEKGDNIWSQAGQ